MADFNQLAKDFAGPLATVIASVTAAIITYRFGSKQTEIARSQAETAKAAKEIAQSQRDIAYDKLKHDLFDKRYEVYTTAKELIVVIISNQFETIPSSELRDMRVKLDEARFFFPLREARLFSEIDQYVEQYLIGHAEREVAGEDGAARMRAAGKMTDNMKILIEIHTHFPDLMKEELGFSQLTRSEELL